jgi:hypothetical protein
VARDIGTYADKKAAEAKDLAKNTDDPALKAKYLQEAKDWSEGGDYRALMHTAGGAIVAGLGGGNALGGALGAGVASKLGGALDELSDQIRDSHPTGNADIDQALAQIVTTSVGTAIGAAAGGSSGAFTGYNVDRFNRQLHPTEEKAIHDAAGGDKKKEERLTQAACYRVQCWAQYSPNSDEYLQHYVSAQDARGLTAELAWVDSQTKPGMFDYTVSDRFGDSVSRQFDEAGRGIQRVGRDAVELLTNPGKVLGQAAGQMQADALAKASERPEALIVQGVANGLNAVVGGGGGKPPTVNPGAALVQGAAGAEVAAGMVTSGQSLPSNVIASSTGSGDGTGKEGGNSNSLSNGGKTNNVTSPNASMRETANAGGSYVDPLTGKVVQTEERLAADHIVPQSWIKQQPGFDQLTPAQQSAILNDPANTQGLPKTFNSSKGAQMPGEWQTYKGQPLDQEYIRSGVQQAETIKSYIIDRINALRGTN